jgi:cysteinyl-tRNA synthetase
MTDIRLYNTRTRKKELFEPIDPANVRMYVCGPTVYDRAHIGNARPVVVFDVLYRLLRHVYGEGAVTYARNITDVDDRIIKRAVETKGADETLEAACRRITDETIAWYHEDMDALGALRPGVEPRCTEYIPQMVEMTQTLIDQSHAYEAEGHVLFAVDTYDRYGALARRSLDDMVAGSRVEVAPYKKNPMDFVLWKPSTPEQPGWDSPWGRGRPGWHIECSAMAGALFGPVFDIHGGGIDLAFPHHENEVAQSCCANHTEVMANVWMHNGFLQVEGEKMAKSLGNFFTVKDLLDKGVLGEVIRFVLLSTHYRQPLDWTERRVHEAEGILQDWFSTLLTSHLSFTPENESLYLADPVYGPDDEVIAAVADDLNTPRAIARLHALSKSTKPQDINALLGSLVLLGLYPGRQNFDLLAGAPVSWSGRLGADTERMINDLVHARQAARKARDFARADQLRDRLRAAGVNLTDTPDGPAWELKHDFDVAKLEALK